MGHQRATYAGVSAILAPMRRRIQTLALLPTLLLLAGVLPFICAALWIGQIMLRYPLNQPLHMNGSTFLMYSLLGFLAGVPAMLGMVYLLRARAARGPSVEVFSEGLEPGDYELIKQLFPHSHDVRLSPLSGGFSGAIVLRAQSWNGGALQRTSVVKIGAAAKLQPETENWERTVREYVGNTAALLHVAQRGNRMALRWAYAAFIGERVQTLAEYAATGAPLGHLTQELFAGQSTLGLLLGTPRRDPHHAVYRAYSWTPRDWQKIRAAADQLYARWPAPLERPALNPLTTIARWCDPDTGSGDRAAQRFDVPVATIHGDLHSRNVLIDERGSIFVIDWAHARPAHMLRDFARLEMELLLVLDQPADLHAVRTRAAGRAIGNNGKRCGTHDPARSVEHASDQRPAPRGDRGTAPTSTRSGGTMVEHVAGTVFGGAIARHVRHVTLCTMQWRNTLRGAAYCRTGVYAAGMKR